MRSLRSDVGLAVGLGATRSAVLRDASMSSTSSLRFSSGAFAAEFEQLEAERFDLSEHAMQRGPLRQAAREHGVASRHLRVEARERREQRLAQHSANANLAAGGGRRILHDLRVAGARVTAHHTNGVTTARTVHRDAEEMKFALALVLAAAIATLGGAHLASAEWQTTQPTLLYTVSAVLTTSRSS